MLELFHLRYMIDSLSHFFIQSEIKQKLVVTRLFTWLAYSRFRALCRLAASIYIEFYFVDLIVSVLSDWSENLSFGSSTLNWKHPIL